MEKIILTATAESIDQVKHLLELGVDRIYIGEENFGLRLPYNFTLDEISEITELVHSANKEIVIACNALMHQDMMKAIPSYLDFLKSIGVDYLVVGDTGVFYINKRDGYNFKLIYDTSVFVTSSRQINFWGQHGACGAVLAREIPQAELFKISENLEIPAEILVYGASVIHHSKRPLLENYFNFTKIKDRKDKDRGLFLSEPNDAKSHYSIYEDKHGTHIFINNDISMMTKLQELYDHHYTHWKIDGIFCSGQNYLDIVSCFIKARELIYKGTFTEIVAKELQETIQSLHPKNRGLDTGFYDFEPGLVK